jgi:peroxiredoxin
MKTNMVYGLLLLLIVFSLNASERAIPSVKLKDTKGKTFDTKDMNNDGKPFIINFWATWCKPCIQELNNINDHYEKWQKESGIKVYAISIDDSRNSKRVAPFVSGRGWTYEILLDQNSDLKRSMNVNNPPHTFLVDGKGNIVWEHNGYAPGDETELYKKYKELLEKGN